MIKKLFVFFLAAWIATLPVQAVTPYSPKPPVGAMIDWSKAPSGLVGVWLMNEGVGSKTINLVNNNRKGTNLSGNWTGSGILFSTTNAVILDESPIFDNLTNFTYIVKFKRTSTIAAANYILGKVGDSNIKKLLCLINTEDYKILFKVATSGTDNDTRGNIPTLGKEYVIAAVFNNNVGYLYSNGVDVTSARSTPSGTIDADDNSDLIIGNREALDREFGGIIDFVYILNRAVPPSEIQKLSADPFYFIKSRPWWYKVAAVVGGWTHSIMGVSNASIGKINGVDKANVAKVNNV